MPTQSGSYDFKAAKEAHDAASKVATNYVLDVTDGVFVHPDEDTTNGVQITDKVDIIRNSDSIAQFGSDIRIGKDDDKNVLIDSNGLNIRSASNVLARFGSTSQIGQDNSYRIEFNQSRFSLINMDDVVVFGAKSTGVTQPRRSTRSYTFSTAHDGSSISFPLPSGLTLVAGSTITLSGRAGSYSSYTFDIQDLTFIAGTAATKSAKESGGIGTLGSIAYDGTRTFTITNALNFTGHWYLSVQYDVLGNTDMGSVTVTGVLYDNNLAGAVQMYAGQITQSVSGGVVTTTAPTGWLLCDGSAVSRTMYDRLFRVIDTTYGAGDGSTTFNLPDMRGTFPLGVSNSHPITGIGSIGGSENAIIPYHRHALGELTTNEYAGFKPSLISASISTGSSSTSDNPILYANAGRTTANRNTAYTGASNTGGKHSHKLTSGQYTNYTGISGNTTGANMPPYRTVNFIIATGQTS